MAFVFQNYAFYPHLNGDDNITVPLVMHELSAIDRLTGNASALRWGAH